MGDTPSPFVFWAQTKNIVTLKVDLKDATKPQVDVEDHSLKFSAVGHGAAGKHRYAFQLSFYGKLNANEIECKVLDSHIFITLKKTSESFWPRLINAAVKPAWLKIDFDRWTSEDMTLDEDEEVGDIRDAYPGLYDQLEKEERGYRTEEYKKAYLVIYNLCQFVGFLYIVIVMFIRYIKDGPDSMEGTYDSVGTAFKLCTLFQWLEVMHPMFGYTRNSVFHAFLQVAARSFVLFAMIEAEERMQTKPVVFYLFLVWSLIEIVRYPYYVTHLNQIEIGFLTWLRYTLWIPLYPLGFLCEGIIILRNIPYFEETKRFSVALPNEWNYAFDLPSVLRVYLLLLFLPGSYTMMNHMYRDRIKRLGPKKFAKKA